MSDRPGSRRAAPRATTSSPNGDEAPLGLPDSPVAVPAATRGGDDTRRRGWFWHWNSIVTQYAPLIGLKGIGLLNSYTVWTDRREESPHRGFAFPSQQREADFYGEDRAELITINKLLVALDLIEIRKEMVLRVDEQGRRWKVPHNFYRVKDHDDGSSLTADAVLAVAHLADRDRAVYRYVRRVFSPRFAAIDRDNVWATILEQVRPTEVWQRLSVRALKDETRASDRSRAGHAARKGALFLTESGDTSTPHTTVNDSDEGISPIAQETNVASINTGLVIDVDPDNNGLTTNSTTSVAPTNTGDPTAVDQTNRTYHQDVLTTTTTTLTTNGRPAQHQRVDDGSPGHNTVTPHSEAVTGGAEVNRGFHRPPSDGPGEQRALRTFEDANGRPVSAAERTLLSRLAQRFDRQGQVGLEGAAVDSGWALVAAAIYEAVEAGSTFVAPRRLREIMTRWERDGLPNVTDGERQHPRPPAARGGQRASAASPVTARESTGRVHTTDRVIAPTDGHAETWTAMIDALGGMTDASAVRSLINDATLVSMRDGEIAISVSNRTLGKLIDGQHRDAIEQAFAVVTGRPVRISVQVLETISEVTTPARPRERTSRDADPVVQSFLLPECGLPSSQVWAAVIDEVVADGDVSQANVDSWLRSTRLIGRGAGGSLIVGTAHSLARRRIESRFVEPVARAVEVILGTELRLEFVIANEWLALHTALDEGLRTDEVGAA